MDDYYFFLSYSRRDYDPYLTKFYKDLASEVQLLTGNPSQEIGYFDQLNIHPGTNWPDALAKALQTSRVLVCMYSPAYFNSEFNGKEVQIFLQRSEQSIDKETGRRAPSILPVLWSPTHVLPSLPNVLSKIQHLHAGAPKVYEEEGLRYMMRLSKFKNSYFQLVRQLSSRLVQLANSHPLPPLNNMLPIDQVQSAFQPTLAPPPFFDKIEQVIPETSKPSEKLRAFLCHASDDKPSVRSLYRKLRTDGVDPWLDEENLLPGQKWQNEIPKAVRQSHVVIVCLSQKSINKAGYVQKEITFALDVAEEQPEGSVFIIPIKLEECEIPDRLKGFHYGKLFEEDGYQKLMNSLKFRSSQLEVVMTKES